MVQQFGTQENDYLFALAADSEGAVYGAVEVGNDTLLRRHDPSGELAWVRTIPSTVLTTPRGVAVDPTGDVVLTGLTSGSTDGTPRESDDFDAFTCKYTSTGDLQWCRQYGSAGWDEGRAVAADSTGNIVVVGTISGDLHDENDVFTRVYGPDGTLRWSQQFGPSTGTVDILDVAIDGNDEIYVVGAVDGDLGGPTLYGDGDLFIRKFSLGGDVLWTRRFGTGRHLATVSVSDTSQVFATMGSDAISLTGDGELLWVEPVGTSGDENPLATAMHRSGLLLVTGSFRQEPGDVFFSALAPDGTIAFERTIGTVEEATASVLATSRAGLVFIGGWTSGTWEGMNAGGFDAFILQVPLSAEN